VAALSVDFLQSLADACGAQFREAGLPQGFRNRELWPLLAQALGLDHQRITQGKNELRPVTLAFPRTN